jgi:hypothetical protein
MFFDFVNARYSSKEMKMRVSHMLTAAAAIAVGGFGFATQASAMDADIAGSIFWDSTTPTTLFSAANGISNFTFDVNTVLPAGSPSTTVAFTDFEYSLNNVIVTPTLTSITFYESGPDVNGMFDLNFGAPSSGEVVSVYGANIGNIGAGNVITAGGVYPVTAALVDAVHNSGSGDVVVSIDPVPLPAALPMFAMAIGGLAFFGMKMSRRVAAA